MSNIMNSIKKFFVALWNSELLSDEEMEDVFGGEEGTV